MKLALGFLAVVVVGSVVAWKKFLAVDMTTKK